MARRLMVTLAARAVVAKGYEFSPRGGSFADADVALDEILNLPPPAEPLVLRVTATGGRKRERASLMGDWLYDTDTTFGNPRRIPPPAWSYSEEALAWSERRPWLEAWEDCQDARWMLHAAVVAAVDRRLIVTAACTCARMVLGRAPLGEERPRQAIEIAEAWARGEAAQEDVERAADDLYMMSTAVADAAYFAASVANRVDVTSDATAAAEVAENVASVARISDRGAVLANLAALVRRAIPTLEVLRAVATMRRLLSDAVHTSYHEGQR